MYINCFTLNYGLRKGLSGEMCSGPYQNSNNIYEVICGRRWKSNVVAGVNPRDRILDPEARLQHENQIFEPTFSHKEISPGMENATKFLNP